MPLDVQSAILAQVKALLTTYAPFTALVKPGNIITDDAARQDDVEQQAITPGHFPRVRITIADDTTNDRPMMPMNDDPALMDMPIPMRLRLAIDIKYDSTDATKQTPVEAAVRGALLRSGRNLGLQWVTSYADQPISRRVEVVGQTARTVARKRLDVTAVPLRSQLIAL